MKNLKKKSFTLVISLIMVVAMFLTACSKSTEKTNDNNKQKNENVRVITDMESRKVEIPKEIKSVATVGSVPVINSFVMCLGEGDKIINGLPDFVKMPKWKYQIVFAPNLKDKEVLQDQNKGPDVEKLLAAKPDVVLTMDKSTADTLDSKGIKTVVLNWKDVDDVEPLMTLLGEIFGKEDKAKEYAKYFNDTVKKAEDLTRNISEDKKITAMYTSVSDLSQPHLIAEWWIKAAGGVSVTDDGRIEETLTYSIEQLLDWNPDVIIVSNKKDIEELKNDDRLSTLKAVKNDKVYVTPTGAHVWANRTIEQPLTVLWTLNKLYPEKYSQEELVKDVGGFYKTFFNTELTEDQIQEIISGNNK